LCEGIKIGSLRAVEGGDLCLTGFNVPLREVERQSGGENHRDSAEWNLGKVEKAGGQVKIISKQGLDELTAEARDSPRLRKNLNLHASYDEPCQRLLNAMEPGSYIRPHRHLRDPKPECFIGVRGRMAVLLFRDNGEVDRIVRIGPEEENYGLDIPPGVWHSVVCLEKGSVFFEAKPGPFNPSHKKDMASWAPEEGSPEAGTYLEDLVGAATSTDKPKK